MEASEFHYATQRTARYYLLGEVGGHIENIFVVLHGYGHLPKYFSRKFTTISTDRTLVLVPEGLHRFYLDKEHKRVGASWMTREDRLTDISDQVQYLDGLLGLIRSKCPNFKKTYVFGFSQGTATASRWIAKSSFLFNALILWAGALPPDLEHSEIDHLKTISIYAALGNDDEFITEDRFTAELERLKALGLKPRMIRFTGTHDIPEPALLELTGLLGI